MDGKGVHGVGGYGGMGGGMMMMMMMWGLGIGRSPDRCVVGVVDGLEAKQTWGLWMFVWPDRRGVGVGQTWCKACRGLSGGTTWYWGWRVVWRRDGHV